MQTSASPSIRDASTGLLWKLGLIDIAGTNQTNEEGVELEQIMLSYDKDNVREARKLRDILLAAGFKVWMDVNKGGKFYCKVRAGKFQQQCYNVTGESGLPLSPVTFAYRLVWYISMQTSRIEEPVHFNDNNRHLLCLSFC